MNTNSEYLHLSPFQLLNDFKDQLNVCNGYGRLPGNMPPKVAEQIPAHVDMYAGYISTDDWEKSNKLGKLTVVANAMVKKMKLQGKNELLFAFLDSVEDNGLLKDNVESLSEHYSGVFKVKLDPVALERVRTTIRDKGPVLGLLSHTDVEAKACISRFLYSGEYKRDYKAQNQYLNSFLQYVVKTYGSQSKDYLKFLSLLAGQLEKQAVLKRKRVSISQIQTILNCNKLQAGILQDLYIKLPSTPLGN